MADKAGPEEDWTTRGIEFGEAMGDLLRILEAVETGVEADDYPRAMHQASIEKTNQWETRGPESRQEEARERTDHGQGKPREGTGQGEHADGQRRTGTTGQEGDDTSYTRQFPQSPAPRRPNPDSRAYGGWDIIDSLTITQCAVRPPGLQTVKIIPPALQDEWAEAWNDAHMQRQSALTEEERERALKWIMWLPQGPLHAPKRGGKGVARQYREPARRFVMWRQWDMLGLVKAWKTAAIAAGKRLYKTGARKAKGDQVRVARAIRLLRRGAISRAGHALESKGIGDLTNGEIWNQMKKKHPARKEQIKEEHYQL